jgi:competence protein ComEA
MTSGLGKIAIAVIISLAAGVILTIGVLSLRNRETAAPIKIVPPQPTATDLPTITPSPIQVFVSGEVLVPDVYALAPGSRIKQLVEAAGGFTDKANTAVVNLAQPLTDGVHVHIPAEGELASTPQSVLSDPAAVRSSVESDLGTGGALININTAGLIELDILPGIGPATAQKILDYRSANGSFTDIETIMDVPGIGQVKFDQIKALITIGN